MATIKTVGLDIFVRQADMPSPIKELLAGFELVSIANRGTQIWPGNAPKIELTDVHRLRFLYRGNGEAPCVAVLTELEKRGYEWVQIEKLLEIDGTAGFSS